MGIVDLMGRSFAALKRRRQAPERDTVAYARLMQLGVTYNQKAQVKPSPPNLRYFSRTPYARACIRAIRDQIQHLEWEIVPKKGVKPNREINKQIAIATACFEHPNNDINWQELAGQITEDWLVFGAGVIEQQIGTDPIRPLWMWPVDAESIQIFAGWSGDKNEARYIQTIGYTNVGYLQGRKLRNDEIVFIRANSSTETPYGFGPLEIAYNTLNRQLGTAEFAGNLASNAQPQTMLYFKDADNDKLRAFKAYWRNEVEGQGVTPMFGGKNEPTAVALHPGGDSALYLEYQTFIIREIATAFGLSPMNLGIAKDVNRNTAEVEKDRDWDNAVVPPAELIMAHMTRNVLHSKLHYYQLEFNFKGLYREDEESLADIYQTYYKNNAVTPNMDRLERGLPPIQSEWADKTYADFQIAFAAARGTKDILDPSLTNPNSNSGDDSSDDNNTDDKSLSNEQNKASFDDDNQRDQP